MVTWVEYDYNTANLWQDTTWPDIHEVPAIGICDGGCAQGDLWRRETEDGEMVSASSIISALEAKRQEIDMYMLLLEGHMLVEEATPWGLDDLWEGSGMKGMMGYDDEESDDDEDDHHMDEYGMCNHGRGKMGKNIFEDHPTAPMQYDGPSFDNTITVGGYGSLTSGVYSLGPKNSGFKAQGSLGQGADGLGAALDTSEKDRYMIVTITSTA